MRYENFSYLWPPRPESAVSPDMLPSFEKRGWICQTKFNGQCSVIFVAPDRSVTYMNRHNEAHKSWTAPPEMADDFADLPGNGWYVFVAELLHNKVKGIKDINYVHDVLVADGDHLFGKTQEERQDILFDLLMTDDAVEARTHFVVSPHLWLTMEYEADFATLFKSLTRDEEEGLVLKDPKQVLALPFRQKANSAGLVKVRRAHKNYSF